MSNRRFTAEVAENAERDKDSNGEETVKTSESEKRRNGEEALRKRVDH
jgi:hypothetical protein